MSTRKTTKKTARAAAARKTARTAAAAVPMSGATLDGLIEENRRLGEEMQAARKLAAALERTNTQSIAVRDQALKELEALKAAAASLKTQAAELAAANKKMTAEIARLSKQVERTPLNPLAPEEAALLFDKFIGGLKLTRGLELRDVNLTLKVATGKFGDQPVLLLPEPGSVDPAALHELKFNLRGTTLSEALAAEDSTVNRK